MERRRASIDWCFPTSVSHSHRFPLFVTRAASQLHPSPQHRSSHLLFLLPSSFSPPFPSPLVPTSSSSSISSFPLAPLSLSLFIVIFVLSVFPQLSAFLSFPRPLRRPYDFLRFSPCRPIIRSLFTLIFSFVSRPHTRKPRNLHYFPRTYIALLLFHSSSELQRFLPPFLVASIKAAVSKPIALRSHPLLHAFEIFPAARLFLPLLLSIEQCIAIRNGRLPAAPRRQIQYLISIGKSDECYLYQHCR